MDQREYWNDRMQARYQKRRDQLWEKTPLKVFIVPHSHNDPGWLKTVEAYFHSATKDILDNAVDKLTKYKNMTFVWTEISFLAMWYDEAHDARRANLHQLVQEGRFEILTGGWVMTDEACPDLFSMLDQLIEGHQWLKNYLNYTPKHAWSVDPFGHGGTFPYLLKSSGIEGAMIMRIHYAWKEWFAIHQRGDFLWHQAWDSTRDKHSLLTHNFPYDIYSIKGSCGPHAQVCLEFNYQKVEGKFNEYTARYKPVNPGNVQERSELLLEQYGKTGSLFPHNVVLVPLGDDFTYTKEYEFDQQYSNYMQIINFINSNKNKYHAEVQFGTMADYFKAVNERISPENFNTLNGDFFVYSDIFMEGRPAYWSGYFATRPYLKQLSRKLGSALRTAEYLYTVALNRARSKSEDTNLNAEFFESLYLQLVEARRNLALFQHHDAITGTSKQLVMHDYANKMFAGLKNCRRIHKSAIQYLTAPQNDLNQHLISEDFDQPTFNTNPSPIPLNFKRGDGPTSSPIYITFNPTIHTRRETLSFFVDNQSKSVCVYDAQDPATELRTQVSPTQSANGGLFRMDTHFMEVSFEAVLLPLTLHKFFVRECESEQEKTQIFCTACGGSEDSDTFFTKASIPKNSAIQLENEKFRITFDSGSGLMQKILDKHTNTVKTIDLMFASYPTAQFRSGAYLFKLNPYEDSIDILFKERDLQEIVIVSGAIYSEISVIYIPHNVVELARKNQGDGYQSTDTPYFIHTVRLYHETSCIDSEAIHIENDFYLGDSTYFNDVDIFMRFNTDIKNVDKKDSNENPVFHGDMNGLQMQKRTRVPQIGIEGNYFPITQAAYIEDEDVRLTLIVDHATGAASYETGQLEVMVDRRSTFDDSRGMGEGVLDNRPTVHSYKLLLEKRPAKSSDANGLNIISSLGNILARNLEDPPTKYVSYNAQKFEKFEVKNIGVLEHVQSGGNHQSVESHKFSCDMRLLNLRTLSSDTQPSRPTKSALLIFRQEGSADCLSFTNVEPSKVIENLCSANGSEKSEFPHISAFEEMHLTGAEAKANKTLGAKLSLKKNKVNRLSDFHVEPMTISTIKIDFN